MSPIGPRTSLLLGLAFCHAEQMGLPDGPITLTPEQLAEFNKKLSTMRHDINNSLSLIVAAAEMIRLKPQTAERMLSTMAEQPSRITALVNKFSSEFEQALGLTKP